MRSWAWYPFLLSLSLVFGVYAANMDEVKLSEVVLPMLLCLAGAGCIWLVLRWRFKGWGTLAASAIVFALISPYLIGHNIMGFVILVLAYAILVGYLVKQKWQPNALARATPYLNIAALVVLLPCLVTIGSGTRFMRGGIATEMPVDLSGEYQPDIYYLLMDGYARADTLERVFDFDNSAFLDDLRGRGFYVADQSYANYRSTEQSLYASLNMDYLPAASSSWAVEERIQSSRVAESLKAAGYTFIQMGDWWDTTGWNRSADINYNRFNFAGFSRFVLRQTLVWKPIGATAKVWGMMSGKGYSLWENTVYKWQKLAEIPEMSAPTFTFAHFIVAHEPYTFNADGSENVRWGHPEGAYQDAVEYSNTELLRLLDVIPADDIVIIQADHGSWPETTMSDWDDDDRQERYAILNAVRMPCAAYPGLSPVNNFRLMFRDVFGAALELLPDESFIWSPGTSPVAVSL